MVVSYRGPEKAGAKRTPPLKLSGRMLAAINAVQPPAEKPERKIFFEEIPASLKSFIASSNSKTRLYIKEPFSKPSVALEQR